jgi:hypothetical protein
MGDGELRIDAGEMIGSSIIQNHRIRVREEYAAEWRNGRRYGLKVLDANFALLQIFSIQCDGKSTNWW